MEDVLGSCVSKQQILHQLTSWSAHEDFQHEVRSLFQRIQQKYHNDGTSPWSDTLYDTIVELLKVHFQLDVETDFIGADVAQQHAVSLPYFMGSMNKFKSAKLVHTWMKKYRAPYIISAKLDGISAMFCKGKLYTRGNGSQGRDISYLIPFVIPASYPFWDWHCGVRGELIMRKSIFHAHYADTYANSRNLVCGLLNRSFDATEHMYHHIDFVAYDVYHSNKICLSYEDKFDWLSMQGFAVVPHQRKINTLTLEHCDLLLSQWKSTALDYAIDGIIISNYEAHHHGNVHKNPDFAFAYKNNDLCVDMSIGVVKTVCWAVSKDNYIKPTIQLKSPVTCDQSQIQFVTGFNAKYIVENRIQPGTRLKIGLSGNVIPHIFQVLHEESDAQHGDDGLYLKDVDCSYSWSKNHVDIICNQHDNYQRSIKQNMQFFGAFDFKCNLQEKTLYNIYETLGVYRLEDILSLSLEQLLAVPKMGEKKAKGILKAFYDTLHWPCVKKESGFNPLHYFLKLCLGLQCYERGFAMKKINLYVSYIMNIPKVDFKRFHDTRYIEMIQSLVLDTIQAGGAPKQITAHTMALFLEGFRRMNEKMKELHDADLPFSVVMMKEILSKVDNVAAATALEVSSHNNGDTFVFSGFRNAQWNQAIQAQGGKVEDRITKVTTALVVKDKSNVTGKIKQAIDQNIPVYTLHEFINKYKNQYKDIAS